MAEGLQISIKDRDTAMSWLANITLINEDYHVAMKEATECIQNVNEFGEGTLIDELVQFGTDLLNAGETIFTAIDEIADTVTNVIDKVENFVGDAVSAIGSAIGNIFG